MAPADSLRLDPERQRWWFLDQLDPGAALGVGLAIRLRGALDEARLLSALQSAARLHASLHTSYDLTGDGPVQRPWPGHRMAVHWVDVTTLEDCTGAAAAGEAALEIIRAPYVLSSPPNRAGLLKLSSTDYVLALAAHRIGASETSLQVWMDDIAAFYNGAAPPVPEALDVQPSSQADGVSGLWAEGTSCSSASRMCSLEGAGELTRELGAPPGILMLGALFVLCSRNSGHSEIEIALQPCVLGWPTPRTIGPLDDRVPLRMRAPSEITFRAFIQELQRRIQAATPGRASAGGVVFAGGDPEYGVSFEGLSVEILSRERGPVSPELRFGLRPAAHGFELWTEAAGVRPDVEASHLALWWEALAKQLIAHPDLPIGSASLLDPAERERIVEEGNRTEKPLRLDRCLHELFFGRAAAHPERIALVSEGGSASFGDLANRALGIASGLKQYVERPEERIAIFLERSPEMIASILGVLAAGACFVPLDPEQPDARLAAMAEDARPAAVIASEALRARAPRGPWKILDARALPLNGTVQPATVPGRLAYIMYTSGTTGTPKGVMTEHRAICNRILWMQGIDPLHDGDAVLQKTAIGFDVALWEIFWPLIAGARLVLAQPGLHRDPEYLHDLMRTGRITTMQFVPSMLSAYLDRAPVEELKSLRRVIVSGEALPEPVKERFLARSQAKLYNLYGPTETAIEVTCELQAPGEPVTIGRPIANARAYVLDGSLQPVPPGWTGELYIGGAAPARGYFGRPDLTAERFLADPFASEPGARMYCTGDRARIRQDGAIEYLGRKDRQVKIRGVRIEPGEIESVLCTHESIAEAAVKVEEAAGGEQRLAVYIAPRNNCPLDVRELREWLRTRLPGPMVPAAIVPLGRLPRTPNGKIDYLALQGAPATAAAPDAAPRTEAEMAISKIWCELLDLPAVGLDDNFFDLGGHSLLILRLQRQLEQKTGLRRTIAELFNRPTVRLLAAGSAFPAEDRATGKDRAEKRLRLRYAESS